MPYDPVLKKNLVKKVLAGPVNKAQDPHVLNATADVVISLQSKLTQILSKKRKKKRKRKRERYKQIHYCFTI